MSLLRLPGLVDAHVHLREPGYEHKEDFYSGTVAALAGGVTTVLDMPNTVPPTATPELFTKKAALAAEKAVCDVGLFVGATTTYADAYLPVAENACGLKIYVSDTFGSLRIERLALMDRFFRSWAEQGAKVGYRTPEKQSGIGPIAVHAEELMLPVCLNLCHIYDVPLHIVHVSRRSEIELIVRAKERGYRVTCEATPHHLFLDQSDAERLGSLGDMRPRLATSDDVDALWEHFAAIDVIATDHAPHTLDEKGIRADLSVDQAVDAPPPGVPGVETMLPLLLAAVQSGRMEINDIREKCVIGAQKIYGLLSQPDTYIEVDAEASFMLDANDLLTRVGWSPFAGASMVGRVERVVLRGEVVFEGGKVVAKAGSGHVLFED